MFADQPRTRERATSAVVSAVLLALLGWMLIGGLSVTGRKQAEQTLQLLQLAPVPLPPREKQAPRRAADPRRDGAAAPPNLVAKATPLVLPPPPVRLPHPQAMVTSPVAGQGGDPDSGAAPLPGPGSGSGGQGDGTGSGDGGDGDGGGGGGSPPRYDHGRVRFGDLSASARADYVPGTVEMQFSIGTDGRLTRCRVTRSGGSPALDADTCRLSIEKLRFRPARDAAGRAVPSVGDAEQHWSEQRRADPD